MADNHTKVICQNQQHSEYIFGRRLYRVLGAACVFAVVVPATSRPLRVFRAKLPEPLRFFPLWLPNSMGSAALMGAFSGLMEDLTARIAFKETLEEGRKEEPELWTLRALIPALATFLHPLVAWKYLDGELKGGETAMAAMQACPIQQWPFFAIDDATTGIASRFAHRVW
eukprot:CAMPEP_0198221284 /NCGR_PEP_ID=MMETSP1445-20131203/83005_1 /TAXON_ID=36898 /ORGANISM="Pyramimonas sp., Strain CCMP2087" /LENGTH=169 /DNA_ID=CAMNT_0043899367 /DNA_START=207 /DNA_END=713 /DNA_ORIENTATION=+